MGVREREARAVARQSIEVRRPRLPAVRRQRVGAQRVDGHEQDVLLRVGRQGEGVESAAPTPGRAAQGDDDQGARQDAPPVMA